MSNKMDMSLDDIVKQSKSQVNHSRGKGGARRSRTRFGTEARDEFRGTRNRQIRKPNRPHWYNRPRVIPDKWEHDLFDGDSQGPGISTGVTKLLISNLHHDVSDTDIRDLFEEFGTLREAAVHYDRSGRSLGEARVIFERRADAFNAMKRYDEVPLDGRPMHIKFSSSEITGSRQEPQRNQRSFSSRGAGDPRSGGRYEQWKNAEELDGRTMEVSRSRRAGRSSQRSFYSRVFGGHRRGGPYDQRKALTAENFLGRPADVQTVKSEITVSQRQGNHRSFPNRVAGGHRRGGRYERRKLPTAEELDAELDAYRNGCDDQKETPTAEEPDGGAMVIQSTSSQITGSRRRREDNKRSFSSRVAGGHRGSGRYERRKLPTAEELDAELDAYRNRCDDQKETSTAQVLDESAMDIQMTSSQITYLLET